MIVRECMSTCYVLFWIVVVPARDPRDLVTPSFKAKPNAHSMCVQESSLHT
jgi:hypothetical protein